jgi:hypothetical protein
MRRRVMGEPTDQMRLVGQLSNPSSSLVVVLDSVPGVEKEGDPR